MQAGDNPHQGGFTGAVGTRHLPDLASPGSKTQPVEQDAIVPLTGQLVGLQ